MSVEYLLDKGIPPLPWVKLNVESIKSRSLELSPGVAVISDNYASFTGLRPRAVVGAANDNTSSLDAHNKLNLTFTKAAGTWVVSGSFTDQAGAYVAETHGTDAVAHLFNNILAGNEQERALAVFLQGKDIFPTVLPDGGYVRMPLLIKATTAADAGAYSTGVVEIKKRAAYGVNEMFVRFRETAGEDKLAATSFITDFTSVTRVYQ